MFSHEQWTELRNVEGLSCSDEPTDLYDLTAVPHNSTESSFVIGLVSVVHLFSPNSSNKLTVHQLSRRK